MDEEEGVCLYVDDEYAPWKPKCDGYSKIEFCRDKYDDNFLSAAIVGNAPIIDSGDLDLHAVNGFKGIRVMTPKSFLSEFC